MSKRKMGSYFDYFVPVAMEQARQDAPNHMPSTDEIYGKIWLQPSIHALYMATAASIATQVRAGAVPLMQLPLDDGDTSWKSAQDLAAQAIQQGISCAVSNFLSTKRDTTRGKKWRNWYSLGGRWFHISKVVGSPELARAKAAEYSADIEDLDAWRAHWLQLADLVEGLSPDVLDTLDDLLDRASGACEST